MYQYHLFLLPANISLYGYVTFYLSVDGHLGNTHFFAVINNAAMDIYAQGSV